MRAMGRKIPRTLGGNAVGRAPKYSCGKMSFSVPAGKGHFMHVTARRLCGERWSVSAKKRCVFIVAQMCALGNSLVNQEMGTSSREAAAGRKGM